MIIHGRSRESGPCELFEWKYKLTKANTRWGSIDDTGWRDYPRKEMVPEQISITSDTTEMREEVRDSN